MAEPWPADMARHLEEQLLAQRTVMVRGPLDIEAATRATASLLWLDRTGEGRIDLHLDSPGGSFADALSVVDTIESLHAPVEVRCTGRIEGSALGVVAVCRRRVASPHTRFHLCEPSTELAGRASELERGVDAHQQEVAAFAARLAEATGRPAEHVEAELAQGRWLTAPEALAFGLIDEVAGQGTDPPRPPLGFGPSR